MQPPRSGAAVALLLGALASTGANGEDGDPLAARGWAVTSGAAPGYVADQACRLCHGSIWESYQEVAMARSFYRPSEERIVEALDRTYHHEPSGRFYRMSFVDGTYRFKRFQLDEAGRPINVLERDVDWVLGSGSHARTYIFRTDAGELFQLPIAWYSQTDSWGMAPGYDNPYHLGVQRLVRRECMFCHNAYPDVAAGSDVYGEPHRFPAELPEGVGCQRCHGPGALHAQLALSGEVDLAPSAIVNPGKLAPERRDDICYGCHLQPTVALAGVRRFDRPDYSFRPGQPLSEYQVHLDVVELGKTREERFEINHHPYRLEQSRCFVESEGELSCVTCHDPHRKVAPVDRPAWYGERCLGCHDLASTEAHAEGDPGYCVPCHMPERRPQDVIEVTMTDHRIGRGPFGPEATAPLEEREPIILDASFLYPEEAPAGHLGEVYRAATVIRADGGANAGAVARLEQLLGSAPPRELTPWLDLVRGQLGRSLTAAMEKATRAIFERAPNHPLALEWLGLARAREGRTAEALELIEKATSAPVPRAEAYYNLGVLLVGAGEHQRASEALRRSLEIRPNQGSAWFYAGRAFEELGRPREAVAAYRQALAIEPASARAYVALGDALSALGHHDSARRYLLHGTRAARETEEVVEALRHLDAPSGR